MDDKQIIEYVLETPTNTNPVILKQMLNKLANDNGSNGWIELVEVDLLDNTFPRSFDITNNYFYASGAIYLENENEDDESILGIQAGIKPQKGTTKIFVPVCTEENYYTECGFFDGGGQLYITNIPEAICTGNIEIVDEYYFKITGPGTISGLIWGWN